MKILALTAVLVSAGMLLIAPIEASAHRKDPRGGTIDAQMKNFTP
jgi:hypothetical protein